MRKIKTYMDKLMNNKEFRERFDEEYQNICIGENMKILIIKQQKPAEQF